MSFAQVRTDLLGLYGSARPPASEVDIRDFEVRCSAVLPGDLRDAYTLMNGADHPTDPYTSWVRFWPIEEWRPVQDLRPAMASGGNEAELFLFADYGIECVYYAINLKPTSPQFGSVHALGDTRATQVAPSFQKFVQLVRSDSDELHSNA